MARSGRDIIRDMDDNTFAAALAAGDIERLATLESTEHILAGADQGSRSGSRPRTIVAHIRSLDDRAFEQQLADGTLSRLAEQQ